MTSLNGNKRGSAGSLHIEHHVQRAGLLQQGTVLTQGVSHRAYGSAEAALTREAWEGARSANGDDA